MLFFRLVSCTAKMLFNNDDKEITLNIVVNYEESVF